MLNNANHLKQVEQKPALPKWGKKNQQKLSQGRQSIM